MARTKRKNGPPFVMIDKAVLRSSAWKALSHSEMVVYIYLKANYNGSNNGEIAFPYSQMEGIMARQTLSSALKGLIEKGWIEKTEYGGLYRYYCLYRLTGKFDVVR